MTSRSQPWLEPMNAAIAEAEAAIAHGDVPIGAVVVDPDGTVVAADHNRRVERTDPTAHAEMLVLSAVARDRHDWRLTGHTLVVTLEPCPMCAGAAVNARIDRVVYGAADPKAGAMLSLFNIGGDERLNHRLEIVDGVEAERCGALLSRFFRDRRPSS